jgi:large subunit ribosomal protein L17
MRHGQRKFKVQLGKDANKMLVRKLAYNFLSQGKIVTTEKKAKILKTHIERLVEKTKADTQANKNFLLRNLAKVDLVQRFITSVGPVMTGRVGGYVRLQKLHQRDSDGALMTRVEWTVPVVMAVEIKVKPPVTEKVPATEKKVVKKSTKKTK